MRLLLHGVPDSPPLTGAGLQHQQVAEVNVSGHDLQTASAGSIDDGLVLRGGDERKRQSVGVKDVTDFRGIVDKQQRTESATGNLGGALGTFQIKENLPLFLPCLSSHC